MFIITKYFEDITNIQFTQLEKLKEIYSDWNEKINVISRKDIDNLYERHVLHSLSIAKYIKFKPGTKIVDVGTGGGFPGIPLAIMFPETLFVLNDSIQKKLKIVQEVVKHLDLKNVQIECKRIEKVKNKFDFILGRAVTNFPDFINYTKRAIHHKGFNAIPNGIIYLKGGDFFEELKQISTPYKVIDISTYFDEDFFKEKKIVYLEIGDKIEETTIMSM